MSTEQTNIHPYSLEVLPPKVPGKSFQWAIRKNGKLVLRSSRDLWTEQRARENGMAEIEKIFGDVER